MNRRDFFAMVAAAAAGRALPRQQPPVAYHWLDCGYRIERWAASDQIEDRFTAEECAHTFGDGGELWPPGDPLLIWNRVAGRWDTYEPQENQ